MVLAQDEIDACREAFLAFDKDRYEMKLKHELHEDQQPHDADYFAEFLQVIDNQKDRAALYNDESDMSTNKQTASSSIKCDRICDVVDAFVACGGKPDKSGVVKRDTLVKIIKIDFGLTINIEVRLALSHNLLFL
ncbi:hypothetical protein DYB37_011023 [Aphanomyces astaci]|uniref:Uncharacterized protein n=1 Tax=Aphanomyces astaci TaxID=112090 RepID=A0A3R7BPC4_APHAT|nr:hypothetical protein DYB35_009879 [Aphanomyces astaci]RHZ10967.1 hypothetical protein DYB37_011023 [Aphanomyces astaci]